MKAAGFSSLLASITLLLASITLPASAQPLLYQEGKHYMPVATEAKTSDPSKVEVMEVFWYGCAHCNQFRPVFEQWAKQQGDDVDIAHTPAMWSKAMITHAKVFYTAKALKLQKSMHKEIFDAMHVERKRLTSSKEIFPLFEKHGIDKKTFDKTFDSFGVKSLVNQANTRARGYGITGTPEIVVNGKYRVSARTAGSQSEMLKVVEFLIQKERAALKS